MGKLFHRGAKLTILECPDFARSVASIVSKHGNNYHADLAKGNRLAKVLGDMGRLQSPDQWKQEGKGFFAIRAGRARFYGWYEPDGSFVLSHAIIKLAQKLSPADVLRMQQNQTAFRGK